MKIIITGGAGCIGSHLSDKLLLLGHEVFVIDDLSSGDADNLQACCRDIDHFYQIDICDKYLLSQAFNEIKPDIVYHLAAQINVRKSIQDPTLDAEININGTLNLLSECVKHKVKKFIFSSSGGAIYKEINQPISEYSRIEPLSPYGISKFTAEQYINFYKNIYGLDATIFRFSNVYGERQGERSEAGVLSIFIKNLLKNKPLKVFGSGFQERDFIDVHSVVEALALGICINGTYNVSTGKSTSINDLIYVISKFLPVNQVDYLPAIPGELKYNCLDNQLLQSHGWRPILSLEEGIEKTIKWFKEHLNEESVP